MKLLRFILFPFAIIYGCITNIRNYLYHKNILTSKSFTTPIIAVGNLSVGGTGKTPQIEYLTSLLYKKYYTAILSRGYKRLTKGFIIADENATAKSIGDEPFQYYQKFKDITVCVDANRVNGVEQLLKKTQTPEVILLDDAFQHRRITAGIYILLTPYYDLYSNDYLLPTGNLRESRKGAERADSIIITKCPATITEKEQEKIIQQIRPLAHQKVFFTHIKYADILKGKKSIPLSTFKNESFVLVTGIANPTPLISYLKNQDLNFEHLLFPDHHSFSEKDIIKINKSGKKVITTEKDYMRLKEYIADLHYVEITISFVKDQEIFDNYILNYVGQN